MPIPFVGPSYQLDSRSASVQRTINLVPVPIEPGNETTGWVFKDLPGLTVFVEFDVVTSQTFASPIFPTDATDSATLSASLLSGRLVDALYVGPAESATLAASLLGGTLN